MTQKSPSAHHRTTLSGWIYATKAYIDNRKKIVKQQYVLHTFPQYGELRPTSGWDWFGSLGHPSKFQRVSLLDFVTAATTFIGGHPNLYDVWLPPALLQCENLLISYSPFYAGFTRKNILNVRGRCAISVRQPCCATYPRQFWLWRK